MGRYRLSNIIKNNKVVLILIMILIGICIKPEYIKANESNVVRVGYPIVSGFTEIEDGIYTGYAYEYLTEIAKYTGWEYEFIEMSLNDMIYKLRDGEIDLAAGMFKNEQTQELYDFPEENGGYTYTTLSILRDNDSISSANYEALNGIKVGYYETDQTRLNHFMMFCEENGIQDIEPIAYAYGDGKVLIEALKAKEVDAIIGGDLLLQYEEKVVVKCRATPYYFATTKGNKNILAGLNKALSRIKEKNPNFDQQLYNKYFQSYIDSIIHLTQEEQDYIHQMKPLKAVYVDNFAPMQDYNPKTKRAEGVYIDIMELIAQKSGLQYELVKATNHEEAYQMIKDKKADLFISATNSYLQANQYECALTEGYLNVNMAKVMDIKQKNQEGKKIIALPKGYIFTEFDDEYDIQYYDTIEDCLKAVKAGKANLTYSNNYTINRYVSSGYYPNLSILSEEMPTQATIGITKPVNLVLLNIINKAVSSLSDNEIKNIIYANTANMRNPITLKQFFFDNTSFCIGIIMLFIVLIYIIARTKHKRLVKDKLLLLEKSQIDVLTGVYNRSTGIDLVTDYIQSKDTSLYSALIIIDIDHFKQINDCLGHQAGDDLLIEFGQLLKQVFSYEDIIFRLGGDEFIVFMKNLELSNLQVVTNKLHEIHQIMDKEVSCKGQRQKISLSIGAVVTNQVYDFSKLYQEADQILYEVKRNGRNGFKIKTLS